jgi:hypothetical protein
MLKKEKINAEIEKMREVILEARLVKKDSKADELLSLARSYFDDSKFFLSQGKLVEAFEAIVITWAYLDAGLRLKIFSIPAKFRGIFTIE